VRAGAGGLDRGVEREQVRLLGDRIDGGDDGADALAQCVEVAHAAGGLNCRIGDLADPFDGAAHGGCAAFGGQASALACFGQVLGAGSDLFDGARNAGDGAGRVLDVGHLLGGTARDVFDGTAQAEHTGVGRNNRAAGDLRTGVHVGSGYHDLDA